MWIEPEKVGEFDVAIGAQVKTSSGGQLCLIDDDKKVHKYGQINICSTSVHVIYGIVNKCESYCLQMNVKT